MPRVSCWRGWHPSPQSLSRLTQGWGNGRERWLMGTGAFHHRDGPVSRAPPASCCCSAPRPDLTQTHLAAPSLLPFRTAPAPPKGKGLRGCDSQRSESPLFLRSLSPEWGMGHVACGGWGKPLLEVAFATRPWEESWHVWGTWGLESGEDRKKGNLRGQWVP